MVDTDRITCEYSLLSLPVLGLFGVYRGSEFLAVSGRPGSRAKSICSVAWMHPIPIYMGLGDRFREGAKCTCILGYGGVLMAQDGRFRLIFLDDTASFFSQQTAFAHLCHIGAM